MAAIPMTEKRRSWLPWTHEADFQRHLREDADIHTAAKKTSDVILLWVGAASIAITDLAKRLNPLIPITSDLDQIVGRRRFRHQLYALAGKTGHSIKKILGWGGGTLVGLATIAAVNQQAQDLLVWLLSKLTFGTISYRIPAIPPTFIPGIH